MWRLCDFVARAHTHRGERLLCWKKLRQTRWMASGGAPCRSVYRRVRGRRVAIHSLASTQRDGATSGQMDARAEEALGRRWRESETLS